MTKKDYLLKILEQLEPIWDLAAGLRILVEEGALGDDVLDTLIGAVESGIHSVKSEVAKEKMKKGLDALEKMRELEKQRELEDEQELAELDKILDNF